MRKIRAENLFILRVAIICACIGYMLSFEHITEEGTTLRQQTVPASNVVSGQSAPSNESVVR